MATFQRTRGSLLALINTARAQDLKYLLGNRYITDLNPMPILSLTRCIATLLWIRNQQVTAMVTENWVLVASYSTIGAHVGRSPTIRGQSRFRERTFVKTTLLELLVTGIKVGIEYLVVFFLSDVKHECAIYDTRAVH